VFIKNKYGEIRSGWVLLLSFTLFVIVQMAASFIIHLVLSSAIHHDEEPGSYFINPFVEALNANFFFDSLSYVLMIGSLFVLFRLIYKRPIRQMGFYADKWNFQFLFGSIFGVILFTVNVLILLFTGTAYISDVNAAGVLQSSFWTGMIFFILAGLSEEQLARGFMMTAMKTTRNKWVIILVPTVLFTLLHSLNPGLSIFSVVNLLLAGILFAYLFIKTGRLWASIGFHFSWNFVQGFIFGIPVSGVFVPDSALISTVLTGPVWLTGGVFGIEGGAVCTLVLLLGLLFVHFCVKAPGNPEKFWSIEGDLPLIRGEA